MIVISAMLPACTSVLQAQSNDGGTVESEYVVKAAYLYNFAYYIQWPSGSFADDRSPFKIGILGNDPFGDALEKIARDKRINGRQIVISRFSSLSDYTPCHILFVASSADQNVADWLPTIRKTQNYPILTVGDSPGFARQGGTINFYIKQNKVRFEINKEVAKQEQLKISSKLLSLAKIVDSP